MKSRMNTEWPEFVPDLQPEHFLRRSPAAWVGLAGLPVVFAKDFGVALFYAYVFYLSPASSPGQAKDCARAWDETCKRYGYTELLGGEWEAPGAR